MSTNDVAKILRASQLSVCKWENGKTRQRAEQLDAIAKLRTMEMKQAAMVLEGLGG